MIPILTASQRRELQSLVTLTRFSEPISRPRLLLEVGLWGLVIVSLVLDAHTTTVGLERGFVESNPVMRTAFAVFGNSVIWQLKTVVTVGAMVACVVLPRNERLVVPVALGLPWAYAVFSNASLLLGV
jgi:hypothetical protein